MLVGQMLHGRRPAYFTAGLEFLPNRAAAQIQGETKVQLLFNADKLFLVCTLFEKPIFGPFDKVA